MAQTQSISRKIDKEIESAYYKLAQGKEINIMDIPKVFADVKEQIALGVSVETAVGVCVGKYCRKVGAI